jgi:hypothetical protein
MSMPSLGESEFHKAVAFPIPFSIRPHLFVIVQKRNISRLLWLARERCGKGSLSVEMTVPAKGL